MAIRQRVATETAIENSVSVFHIENDEVKGRIIGREGRNIRALEAATGVEIVVDDTPEAVIVPFGLLLYLRMWRYRLRLWRDLRTVKAENDIIIGRIKALANQ